ncbi:hypothetical protein AB1Y20_013890 [Prymnesium parvum]|uniref:ubiquitinyl hydrolase 1 n=2 Tax=Prymnesium parvum TaxID=97485 RepID=A0AB34IE94_PRYPA
MALELLRQSWKGAPMTDDEQKQLSSIPKFSQSAPALPLLCRELHACSSELMCLQPGSSPVQVECNADAATEYTQRKQSAQLNCRAQLTSEEEARVLGVRVSKRIRGDMPRVGTLRIPSYFSASKEIKHIESALVSMLVEGTSTMREAFPLTTADVDDNCLGRKTLSELEVSWSAHQRMPKVSLIMPIECLENVLQAHLRLTQTLRARVEGHVLMHIDRIPCGAGWHASAFVMRRAANLVPRVTLNDLARAAYDCESLRQFNPFLSQEALCGVLRPAIFEWLELCVLEDKLSRMALIAAQGNAEELRRELQEVGREWNLQDHPEWLVFEVEQRLQIRKLQYRVARYLMENPGAVTQVNMGEGKTRVILPMLLLNLANGKRLVRLHFPSALIDEAYFYLHQTLTASLMRRQILRFPFHRDIKLTIDDVERMHDSLMRCMRACGAVCVAPEHRLSLQLKWHEIRLAGEQEELVESLPKLDEIPYLDLIDESDEVLHHKYQLIYAWGHNMMLPAGKERWCAVQATLRLLQTSPKVAAVLCAPNVAKRIPASKLERPSPAVSSGEFDNLRLLPGPMLDYVRKRLVHVLATDLMDDPPYEMRWLEKCDLRDTIIEFITDPKSSLAWLEEQAGTTVLSELQRNQILALRGLLAIGSIVHCCSRRHRVDYGVDERRGKSRRVAVPYRASNSPSERAEYAQPDTLIILTHLSYYHSGISRDDLKEATSVLLSLGPAAQQAAYTLWLETARPGMSDAQVDALDNANKLDVSSEVLLDHLYDVYRYNMEAINFWLDACVLPRETMQAPKRLVANSFNLTDNPRHDVIGFSGTKDNHLLLPLQVSQQAPASVNELLATDGKMCGLIIRNTDVVCLTDGIRTSLAVLETAIEYGVHALIDAGATMAGWSNEQVARHIVSELAETSRLQGVVYFDTVQCTWVVLSRQGRIWLKSCSPIHEKDAFVYFDESRCRGADMKLCTDAKAVLTIGPDMCKDKLMQAAGRMRKLDSGQTLIFLVPAELKPKICKTDNSTLTSLDLLMWVVQNTVKATAAGIPEYCSRASHFCMTKDPEARLLDDVLLLDELYGSSITEENVDAVVCRQVDRDVRRCSTLGIKSDAETFRMWHEIKFRARTYGSDLRIIVSGVEEECERELENERQLEREQERYVPKQKPVKPKQWDFSKLLKATKPVDIADAGVMRLELAMKQFFDPVLSAIPWAECNVYVTLAFIDTVRDSLGARLTDNSEYMRPLDMVAVFPNSEVLLLSEWEADHLLPHMWQARPTDKGPFLVNLSYLREAADKKIPDESIRLRAPAAIVRPQFLIRGKPRVEEITLAGLQLLAGETMFATPERKDCIRALTEQPVAKKAVIHLVSLRGRRHMLPRSDLELICNSDTD